ncbi:MAG: hypothetical protein WC523_04830 [Patescibacteria group bacterium]
MKYLLLILGTFLFSACYTGVSAMRFQSLVAAHKQAQELVRTTKVFEVIGIYNTSKIIIEDVIANEDGTQGIITICGRDTDDKVVARMYSSFSCIKTSPRDLHCQFTGYEYMVY